MQNIMNYSSPDSLTAGAGALLEKSFAGNTLNQLLDLPNLFPDYTKPLLVSIREVTTNPQGFKWGLASGGSRQTVGAGLWLAWMGDAATALVPVYIDTVTASTIILAIGVMSN